MLVSTAYAVHPALLNISGRCFLFSFRLTNTRRRHKRERQIDGMIMARIEKNNSCHYIEKYIRVQRIHIRAAYTLMIRGD